MHETLNIIFNSMFLWILITQECPTLWQQSKHVCCTVKLYIAIAICWKHPICHWHHMWVAICVVCTRSSSRLLLSLFKSRVWKTFSTSWSDDYLKAHARDPQHHIQQYVLMDLDNPRVPNTVTAVQTCVLYSEAIYSSALMRITSYALPVHMSRHSRLPFVGNSIWRLHRARSTHRESGYLRLD